MINKCSILNGAKYFASDGQQNYLVFISLRRIDFISNNSDRFVSSISTGMSHENIKNPHNSDTMSWLAIIILVEWNLKGICLKQDCVSFCK